MEVWTTQLSPLAYSYTNVLVEVKVSQIWNRVDFSEPDPDSNSEAPTMTFTIRT